MKPLRIALALAALAGAMTLVPVAQADRDDRGGHLARAGGPGLERHAGHRAGPRFGDHGQRYRAGHRRYRGHAFGRHLWHRARHPAWHAARWRAAPRFRGHRRHGGLPRHRRATAYRAGIGFTIDGVTFGLVDYGRR